MSFSAGQVVAALLLPPLGVFLHGGAGPRFWTAVGLTTLGFVPGMAFALWTVLRSSTEPSPERTVPA